MQTKLDVRIRWLIRRDLYEVIGIDRNSFEDAWAYDDFLDVLRMKNAIGLVAESNEEVVGYAIYLLQRTRLDVIRLAVSQEHRRAGVGRQILAKLDSKLRKERRQLRIEVRETNLAGQLFLRSQGFKAKRVIRNHYDDTGEDCYVFTWRLGDLL